MHAQSPNLSIATGNRYEWNKKLFNNLQDEETQLLGKSSPDIRVSYNLYLTNDNNDLLGGLTGYFYRDALMIDILFINQEARGMGNGKALMETAEAAALLRACTHVMLNSNHFNNHEFYRALGYKEKGKIVGFPFGGTFYWLAKEIKQ